MNFGYLAFCGNNVLEPSWYIVEILSNVKKTHVNEYRLKPCMLLINAGCFVSGIYVQLRSMGKSFDS